MPIYEYRCESCGQEMEKIQKFNDAALTECPICGETALIKLISASSFRLKGTGWYETDFKTGKKKNGVDDDKSASATSDNNKKPDDKSKKTSDTATTPDSNSKAKSGNASTSN